MKPITLLALCTTALSLSADLIDSTTISIQPLSGSAPILSLAEIKYNPSTLDAEIVSYSPPALPTDSELVRVGVYDAATGRWKSSTSMTAAESFAKGYRPTIVLSLDAQGGVLGVACKSGKIDAGESRDFAPRVKVLKTVKGQQPHLNRPVVLSPEGKVAVPEVEKTMLQKYWWVLLGGVMLLMTTGGGGE